MTAENTNKAPSEKKRSTYRERHFSDLPQWAADDKKHSYRWVSAEEIARYEDGYERRGYGLAKDPTTGKYVRRDDRILGCMPVDQYREFKDAEDEIRDNLVRMSIEASAAKEDELTHEFKKMGGKVKFKFEQE